MGEADTGSGPDLELGVRPFLGKVWSTHLDEHLLPDKGTHLD